MSFLKKYIKKIQGSHKEVKQILVLFFTTRFALTIIGLSSRLIGDNYCFFNSLRDGREYSKFHWLDIWGQWDSRWYRRIAEHWYPLQVNLKEQNEYGFMPFYPLLIKIINFFCHDFFLAGVIISNIALLILSFLLFKLVKLEYSEETASDSVLFLYLFPTAFIFSGVFTESLYLMFVLLSFYLAKKEKWFLSCGCGFFLSLTKITGVLIAVPLLYIYFKQKSFSFKQVKFDIIFFFLILLGPITLAIYTKYLIGDWFAYAHAKQAWGVSYNNYLGNPLFLITHVFSEGKVYEWIGFWFFLGALFSLMVFVRRINFEYWIYGMLVLVIPITVFNTIWNIYGFPRFCVIIFPLFIILAILSKNAYLKIAFIITLTLLQGFLMALWVKGFPVVT